MEKGAGDGTPDDGIVSEDLTQLVEHIELTSRHRLPESHEWELATPTDLDDAPIQIGEVADDDPELDSMGVEEDTQLYTETQADLNQLLTSERRRTDQAAALAAARPLAAADEGLFVAGDRDECCRTQRKSRTAGRSRRERSSARACRGDARVGPRTAR